MPADVFICHDSRDQPKYATPLYHELVKRRLKVWLDKYAIKAGDDIVRKIDHGLTTSRHALLLITPRFLKNDRWASQEMYALLNRQFTEKRDNMIVPLYVGVSHREVQARSLLLAKAFAVRTSQMRFQKNLSDLANQIYRTVALS
jgi:hypothetical protein